MKKSVLGGIIGVAVVIIAIGAFALLNRGSGDMAGMEMADNSGNTSENSEMAAPNTVIIDKLDFQQKEITVKKGSVVTWKNQDTAKHNVVFDDAAVGEVEDSKLIGSGEELKFTFNETGEFPYSCSPHPFMKAKVIVTE